MERENHIEALGTFARLYGYVRFFYPGDEAAGVAWNDYAIFGVAEVLKGGDLVSRLREWLKPVAAGAAIYREGEQPPELELPDSDVVVAWRHIGLELDLGYWPYRSERTNRPRLRPLPDDFEPVQFFEEHAQLGDVLQVPIGSGLMLQLPLALPSVDGRTVPSSRSEFSFAVPEDDQERTRTFATIVVAWNVFQHSYPYFEVLDVDWFDVLHRTISEVLDASEASEIRRARDRMIVPIADGHAAFYRFKVGLLPVKFDFVESEVVVVASNCEIPVGARVLEYCGEPAREVLGCEMANVSGSEQYSRERALRRMDRLSWKQAVELVYDAGSGVERSTLMAVESDYPANPLRTKVVAEVEPNVWYIDGCKVELNELDHHLAELQSARRIIVDFRGYPSKDACDMLGHFIREPEWCGLWQIPLFTAPDRDFLGYSDAGRWQVEPREPYLEAERVFLTGPRAVSYGETVMEIVEQAGMGRIVGEATAGTNGNVNMVDLPDGSTLVFTGMKVLKKDGSQLHLVGVQPDIVARPTIEGIRSGWDDVLDVAVNL